MISAHERTDLVHILKMKGYLLHVEDADLLLFTKNADDDSVISSVTINSRDNEPVVEIERVGNVLLIESFRNVDDLKIFLESDEARQYF